MTNDTMTPAIEQWVVYIFQPHEFHNPGGSPNTIWADILTEHTNEVQSIFASEFLDIDAIRVKTEWRKNEESAGGTMFVVYIEYTIKDIGDVYTPSLIESAVEKLPEGMTLRRIELNNTLDAGIWRKCPDCRGLGFKTQTTYSGGEVEIDCKNCDGVARVLTMDVA